MRTGPCLCGDPACYSCGPQGFDPRKFTDDDWRCRVCGRFLPDTNDDGICDTDACRKKLEEQELQDYLGELVLEAGGEERIWEVASFVLSNIWNLRVELRVDTQLLEEFFLFGKVRHGTDEYWDEFNALVAALEFLEHGTELIIHSSTRWHSSFYVAGRI